MERQQAAAKQRDRASPSIVATEHVSTSIVSSNDQESVTCSTCKKDLPPLEFNRNQLSKKEKARCRICVEEAIQVEEKSRNTKHDEKLKYLKEKLETMSAKGDVRGKLKYESELSALEAEHVTGLKPVVIGRRGRGQWRGRTGRGGRSSDC